MPAFTITADATANTLAATGIAAAGGAPGTVLTTGDRLRVRNVGGSLPSPLAAEPTEYFAIRIDDNTIRLSDTNAHALAGTNIIDLTTTGSGTNTVEFGLPYALPTVVPAPLVQIDSQRWLRPGMDALVALYDLLTGQAQAIWSTVLVALTTTFSALVTFGAGATAAANQHITVSGTGKFKHGSKTIQLAFTNPGTSAAVNSVNFSSGTGGVYVAPVALPIGARILQIRAAAFDSATGPTKFVVGLRVIDSTGSSSLTNAGSQSAGSGNLQTVPSASMTVTVASGTRYWAEAQIQTGTANCAMQGFELDYDQP